MQGADAQFHALGAVPSKLQLHYRRSNGNLQAASLWRGVMRFILVLLALFAAAPATAALKYEVPAESASDRLYRVIHEGGQFTVYASGEIGPGDAQRLRSLLKLRSITDARIAFNSPGGSLAEGLALGRLIRALKLDTEIRAAGQGSTAICASACAYAFAGGVNRFYDEASARLGLHQFYSTSSSGLKAQEAQVMSGILVAYLTSMGVDANAFSVSILADPDDMVWLSEKDAESLAFANNGVQPTTAEIKTVDMRPYLRLDQVRKAGHARVLLVCGTEGLAMMAGIVSNKEDAAFNSAISKRSYIELDGVEALVEGPGATVHEDETLWLERGLDRSTLARLLAANQLDIWTEGGGAVRFGAMLDLRPVKTKLRTYVTDCQSSNRR